MKIAKKGDISVWDNSRGITLLSMPNKVFCHVNVKPIRVDLDQKFRKGSDQEEDAPIWVRSDSESVKQGVSHF